MFFPLILTCRLHIWWTYQACRPELWHCRLSSTIQTTTPYGLLQFVLNLPANCARLHFHFLYPTPYLTMSSEPQLDKQEMTVRLKEHRKKVIQSRTHKNCSGSETFLFWFHYLLPHCGTKSRLMLFYALSHKNRDWGTSSKTILCKNTISFALLPASEICGLIWGSERCGWLIAVKNGSYEFVAKVALKCGRDHQQQRSNSDRREKFQPVSRTVTNISKLTGYSKFAE